MEKIKIALSIIILFFLGYGCTKSKSALKREELKNMSEGRNGIKKIEDFESVKIDNDIWMANNLNVDKLNNGEKIIESKNIEDWVKNYNQKKPSFCYYKFNSKDSNKYGKIYNYYALTSDLAPKGWHIAKKNEWNLLINKYQNSTSSLMYLDNDVESNESGFSAISCEPLILDDDLLEPFSRNCKEDFLTQWWVYSSEKSDSGTVILDNFTDNSFNIVYGYGKQDGFYVRCVRD